MAAEAQAASAMTPAMQTRERLAGAFVLVVMTIACVGWWIGVPILTLWGLGQATEDGATHFVAGVLGVPLVMVLTAPALIWLNGLYLRVTGILARAEADEDESGWSRRMRGPLEPMMFASLAIAVTALSIWFFFIADTAPSSIL
jgi:hypothetical protein